MTSNRQEILNFLTRQHLGVLATLHPGGAPEAAMIHITVT